MQKYSNGEKINAQWWWTDDHMHIWSLCSVNIQQIRMLAVKIDNIPSIDSGLDSMLDEYTYVLDGKDRMKI